jgi:hypothetical protein
MSSAATVYIGARDGDGGSAIERYLHRVGAFLAPASVAAAENALRQP